ncbi:MAG: flavodoxin family protein [Bacteroidales bacterium]|nr:flavodoxin family protein [Bacteroidales bacterium]MBN2751026.1 flavodoxin family protein [Bacteroidales bacterium]
MNTVIINGSPRKHGTVHTILKMVGIALRGKGSVTEINVYDEHIEACIGCMACRKLGVCTLYSDSMPGIIEAIRSADTIVIGTPTHWAGMSSKLKAMFERMVPVVMDSSMPPKPLLKGKKALLVTACSVSWPLNWILGESTGTLKGIKRILSYGGVKVAGTATIAGTKTRVLDHHEITGIAQKLLRKVK